MATRTMATKTFRLAEDAFGTVLGPNGHARQEGWYEAGQHFTPAGPVGGNTNPWTGASLGNRPSGPVYRDEAGALCVLAPDARLEPVD
jgi:hypothetical protein